MNENEMLVERVEELVRKVDRLERVEASRRLREATPIETYCQCYEGEDDG
jgi:hypothetical protein